MYMVADLEKTNVNVVPGLDRLGLGVHILLPDGYLICKAK